MLCVWQGAEHWKYGQPREQQVEAAVASQSAVLQDPGSFRGETEGEGLHLVHICREGREGSVDEAARESDLTVTFPGDFRKRLICLPASDRRGAFPHPVPGCGPFRSDRFPPTSPGGVNL